MNKRERYLVSVAELSDDDHANKAMKILRKYFDSDYGFCLDCDGLVIKEKDCCTNQKFENETF